MGNWYIHNPYCYGIIVTYSVTGKAAQLATYFLPFYRDPYILFQIQNFLHKSCIIKTLVRSYIQLHII